MEPERKIEKLLRAFARKRREKEGAPLEMHPATRRLLQGEIARRTAKPSEEKSGWKWLRQPQYRLIEILCVLTVVMLLAAMLLPVLSRAKSKSQLAAKRAEEGQKERAREMATDSEAAATAAPAPVLNEKLKQDRSGAAVLESSDLGRPNLDGEKNGTSMVDVVSGVAANSSIISREADVSLARTEVAGKDSMSTLTTNSPPFGNIVGGNVLADSSRRVPQAPGSRGVAAVDEEEFKALAKASLGTVKRFVRVSESTWDENLSSNGAPVLFSFAVEQTNQQIRIVDGDGSVYAGVIELESLVANGPAFAGAEISRAAGERYDELRQRDSSVQTNQSYSFQVTGTNRSLNQEIVFTGKLLVSSNGFTSAQTASGSGDLRAQTLAPARPGATSGPPALRISGTAVIDETRRIEIRAVPAAPPSN